MIYVFRYLKNGIPSFLSISFLLDWVQIVYGHFQAALGPRELQ